jgi:hypothetical protein
MNSIKALLQHEALNCIMLLKFHLGDLKSETEDETKSEINDLIEFLTILVKYEDVFLGEVHFFLEEISLRDSLEMVLLIEEEAIVKGGVAVELFEDPVLIEMDRFYLESALKFLIRILLLESERLIFSYDERTRTLKISYIGQELLFDQEKSLADHLKSKPFVKDAFYFQLALEIFRLYGLEFKLFPGEILLHF